MSTRVWRGMGIGAWMALVSAARAEDPPPVVTVESLSTPAVRVISTDSFQYNAIAGNTFAYSLQIYGDCRSNNRDVFLVQGNTPTHPGPPYDSIDVSDLVHPTRWLTSHFARQPDTNLPITWPLGMRQKVVAACNNNLASKMAAGSTRAAVLSQSWNIGKVYVGDFSGSLYCLELGGSPGHNQWGASTTKPAYANVTCDKPLPNDVPHPVPPDRPGG
jgi:hypothetical protein